MDDLTREFKKFAKEQEKKEARDSILNATEKDFLTMKEWMLKLFDQNIYLQTMLEQAMMQNLIGTYQEESITYPLHDKE